MAKDTINQGPGHQNSQRKVENFKAVRCTGYHCGESGNYESGDGRGPKGQEKYLYGKRQNRGHARRVCDCGISSIIPKQAIVIYGNPLSLF